MESMITGDHTIVPEELLPFMDDQRGHIAWIPFHTQNIFQHCSKKISADAEELSGILQWIAKFLEKIRDENDLTGKLWEKAFLMFLLARVVAREFDEKLLPLRGKYEYSFNALIKEGASNIEELLVRMQVPESYPHVAVYYPENNQFETYDIIVVHYLSSSEKTIYGYQLKGGRAYPASKLKDDQVDVRFHIRGQPTKKRRRINWIRPTLEELQGFLGVTGKLLFPQAWIEFLSDADD